MKTILTDADLARLGLQGTALMECGSAPWPKEAVEQGLSGRGAQSVTLALILSGAVPFARLGGSAGAYDVLVEAPIDVPGVVKLVAGNGVRIEDVEGIDRSQVASDEEDANTLFVDARQHQDLFVVRIGESRYVFRAGETLEWWVEALRPVAVAPLEKIAALVAEWVAACDDAWLARQVAADSAVEETWRAAVTAGMFARLYEPPSRERRKAMVQATLRGEVDNAIARPRLWARTLTTPQLETLQDLAFAEADFVLNALDSLDTAYDPEETTWQQRLLEVCRRREDVEGVRLLLHEVGADLRLTAGLGLLDDTGRAFMFDVPVRVAAFDERLRRAASCDPDAWWVEPARWEQPA